MKGIEDPLPEVLLKVKVGKAIPQRHAKKKDQHKALKDATAADRALSYLGAKRKLSVEGPQSFPKKFAPLLLALWNSRT